MSKSKRKNQELADRIEALAAPIVAEAGAVVYDIEVGQHGRSGLVRVVIDRDETSGGGERITIDEITRVAKEVGYLLDVEDVVGFSYRFEVSSPGIERTLKTERQFALNVGREVRLVLTESAGQGSVVLEGRLERVDGGKAAVRTADGELTEIEIEWVRRGRTVYDFDAPTEERRRSRTPDESAGDPNEKETGWT